MRTFKDFNSCFNWIEKAVEDSKEISREKIARQVYEDSKKYTYIDTQTMYDSGQSSDFKNGYVLIKAPQVRWLYYTTWIKPHKNKNAVPQWFEATKTENKTKYQGKYVEVFMACLKK